jgi:CBS domain-containing protein
MKPVDSVEMVLRRKGRQVWSTCPTATVYDAIEIMSEKGIGALPVISGNILVGIVSERDYARKVILRNRSSKHTLVSEIMTTPALTVAPSHTVEECMRMMTDFRLRHLPVVEGDRLIGIVSIGDLVNWTISAHEETIERLESYIAGKYPG